MAFSGCGGPHGRSIIKCYRRVEPVPLRRTFFRAGALFRGGGGGGCGEMTGAGDGSMQEGGELKKRNVTGMMRGKGEE